MEAQNDTPRPGPFGRLLSLAGRAVRPFERLSRRLLGHDGDLKVLAVLAALVVYGLVEPVSAGIERTFSVPVRVLPAGGTTAVVGVSPLAVSVTLRGGAEDFTAFDPDALRIELHPAPEENALSDVLAVGPANVTNVLDRLRVVGVSPASVTVEYDYLSMIVTTNFVAKPRLAGHPVQGIASVSLPTNLAVTVYGSVKKLGAFSAKGIRLPTDAIDVEGKTESFDAVVAIRPPEDSGITSVEPSGRALRGDGARRDPHPRRDRRGRDPRLRADPPQDGGARALQARRGARQARRDHREVRRGDRRPVRVPRPGRTGRDALRSHRPLAFQPFTPFHFGCPSTTTIPTSPAET